MFLDCQQQSVISIYKEGQPLKNFNLETFSFALNPQRVINHVFLIIKLLNQIQQTKTGCKESHFYSLPFGQAEANIY